MTTHQLGIASLNRGPIKSARAMANAHMREGGATLFGAPADHKVCAEWAAWANGTAVRELDFHDTFLAADYSHPGDNIPPVLAVAQQCGKDGRDLMRGIATGYEIQVNLVKAICLHEHKIDHIAHIGPSAVSGCGHAAWSAHGDYLSIGAAGSAHDSDNTSVAQG